jgi:hypothetical protein
MVCRSAATNGREFIDGGKPSKEPYGDEIGSVHNFATRAAQSGTDLGRTGLPVVAAELPSWH